MTTPAAVWDAVVIGGGHNGLVCAAYLGRAGLRTLLLEQRATVGGAAATSEIVPSARVPRYAHTVGRLASVVVRELDLAANGLNLVQPAALVTSVGAAAGPLTLWADPERTVAELATHSPRDAAAWPSFDREVRVLASTLWRLMLMTPPDPSALGSDILSGGLRFAWRYRRLDPIHAREFSRVLPQPIAGWLDDRLESDVLKAMLATRALRYTSFAPGAAGSSLHLLTDSAGNAGGAAGETVYARGGPGALAEVLATAARAAGVTIRTAARVAAISDRDGVTIAVVLEDGEEIASSIVASGLDPRTTLLDLLDPATIGPELGWDATNLRARGVTAKVNIALAGLPTFEGLDGEDDAGRLRGRIVVAPSMRYLDRATDAAKYGRISEEPWLEATIPSLVDPLLVDGAAAGGVRHVMSVIAQSAPAELRDADWETERETLGARVMASLERVAPGIGALVVKREVLSPDDLQAELGMHGGHPLHLEPGLDQWFAWRPLLGLARYRLPVEGVYLCAAGAHPGGGITGLPGRLAAARIVADLKPNRRLRSHH